MAEAAGVEAVVAEAARVETVAVEAAGVEAVSGPAGLHHVELWVPDLAGSLPAWRWLLESMGWRPFQDWEAGKSWRLGDVYLVMEQSPALTADRHERRRPGLNHLAFHAGGRSDVDALVAAAPEHGWTLMFAERHPYAGGPDHYAAYLEDGYGFEVELVAADPD